MNEVGRREPGGRNDAENARVRNAQPKHTAGGNREVCWKSQEDSKQNAKAHYKYEGVEMSEKDQAERTNDLLEKLILLNMHQLGATQDAMAQFLGKSKTTINEMVKSLGKRTPK